MAETISARAEEVNSTLRSTGNSLVLDLSLRGGDVVSKLEQTGQRITDTMITRSNAVSETFRDNAEALAQALNTRGEAVKDMLAARLQAFEDMFNHGGTELTEKISRDADDARQPDHQPYRRIRPHREDLRRRTGRPARPAHAGRVRGHAQLPRHASTSASPPSRQRRRRARPAAVAVRTAISSSGVAGLTST